MFEQDAQSLEGQDLLELVVVELLDEVRVVLDVSAAHADRIDPRVHDELVHRPHGEEERLHQEPLVDHPADAVTRRRAPKRLASSRLASSHSSGGLRRA